MKRFRKCIAMLPIIAIAAGVASCGEPADISKAPNSPETSKNPGDLLEASALGADLMAEMSPNSVSGKATDAAFTASMADFSVDLFKKSLTDNENALISPLSVMLALSMTANGAGGETLAQMETLLGGGIPLSDLNEYLYAYAGGLPSFDLSKLSIANSIWFRDDPSLQVYAEFLQKNADYYGAAAFKATFDQQTLIDVNKWVEENTDGMINEILESIDEDDILYLINALTFDAEWQEVYFLENVRSGIFTDIAGDKQSVDFMHSEEGLYLDDGMATGFVKPYSGGAYSFAALLPNEGVAIHDYIQTLTGEGFLNTLRSGQRTTVFASMPKFEFDYTLNMNGALGALGMPIAFDREKADFTNMAVSQRGNIYIGYVLHKTFISVDELGTKAGAVTMIAIREDGALLDTKTVNLDRPFVFAIIDNATNLPIFIGTLMTA